MSANENRYRRLPTIGELRAIMREGKAQIDPKVAREMELAHLEPPDADPHVRWCGEGHPQG